MQIAIGIGGLDLQFDKHAHQISASMTLLTKLQHHFLEWEVVLFALDKQPHSGLTHLRA